MSLSMMLSVENQIYEFKTTIDDYIVKDYLISENIDNEVIFYQISSLINYFYNKISLIALQ